VSAVDVQQQDGGAIYSTSAATVKVRGCALSGNNAVRVEIHASDFGSVRMVIMVRSESSVSSDNV
jgi:hypothetical protein